jgi:hypothetical protein|tara:strand:+ start:2214 stop:2408 length:195 start_codon:yes stop_codon:yes gene_type:complete
MFSPLIKGLNIFSRSAAETPILYAINKIITLSFSKESSMENFLAFRENCIPFAIKFIKTGLPNF